jgi:hypothetical protein
VHQKSHDEIIPGEIFSAKQMIPILAACGVLPLKRCAVHAKQDSVWRLKTPDAGRINLLR